MFSNINRYQIFTFFCLFWAGLLLWGIILAMIGFFYPSLIVLYLIGGIGFFLYITVKNKSWTQISKYPLIISIISLAFVIILSYLTAPTVFSGRDQGSFSNAAVELSKNHQLEFKNTASEEFFKIYGPGTALNFPGFSYTKSGELITNFPLGYTVWLSIFYSLLGLSGFTIANAVTLFIFFILFFLISRFYLGPRLAIVSWLLAISSFSFSWFFKFTLSENLALFLFWMGIWELALFFKQDEKKLHLFASLFAFLLLAFVRIEAWAFLALVIVSLGIKYRNWKSFSANFSAKKIILPLIFILAVLIISFKINFPFYVIFAKGFLKAFALSNTPSAALSISSSWQLLKILEIYSILNFLILSIFSVIYLLIKKAYSDLLIAFISLPILIYLINPSISNDHPWMLRRFLFVLLPVAIFYSVLFLSRFFTKKIFSFPIIILLFAMNLMVSIPYLNISENKNLLPQVEKMAKNFNSDDLILIDREAAGSGWNMISGPLSSIYGLQATYFMNPFDLEKIDKERFSHVYLIIPDKNIDFYVKYGLLDKLQPKKDYEIMTNILDVPATKKSSLETIEFPLEKNVVFFGRIYELK